MSSQDHAYALQPGFMLEEYQIERVLGSGGFGITYYARDTHLNKAVAIKEYLPNESAMRYEDTTVAPRSSSDAETYEWGLTRFLKEAQVLAGFDHPNINRVHRRLQAHGTAYIVLEYLPGESLSARLKRTGRLSPEEVWRLFNELLSGLAEVHRQDYVHRDIKPGNIMFREDGGAVLVDFGTARHAVGQRSRSIAAILTPGYAPPEQYVLNGHDVGPWTDFYALGVLAYRCVTGVGEGELLEAPARERLASRGQREEDMRPVAELAEGEYDRRLLEAIDWCMRVDERERPREVADLEKALTKEPKPKPPAPSRRADELRALAVAAEQGDAEAQFKLGVRYEKGRGVSRDDEEAVKWYRLAAEQGLADAQYNLGWMYDEGHGVPRDDEEAVIWYRLAAEQGHDDAQYTLGEMYREGEGVPQDDGMAMKWFGLAAEQGNASAQRNLERLRQTPKPDPDSVYALPSGFMLEEYQIERVLGSDGFGITYYARDTRLDKAVVIKEYLPNEFAVRYEDTTVAPRSSSDAGNYDWGLTRFLEEARVLAGFAHPHINKVYRQLEAHGTAYMVLEYLSGERLSARLKRTGRLSPDEVWRLFNELLSGLAEVHRQDYVHRDIKPVNIMFREDGGAVLLDFYMARQVVGQGSESITAILTPGYAPPEQYELKAADQGPWTDFYALGVVAYRCVTGVTEEELPDAPRRVRLAARGKSEEDIRPAVEAAKGEYDRRLLEAIDWCMRVDERKRPREVAALQKMLSGGGASKKEEKPEPAPKPKPESKPKHSAVGAVVALLLGFGVWQWLSPPAPPPLADDPGEASVAGPKNGDLAVAPAPKDARAQYNLGVKYANGRGVPQDDEEAVKWFRLAAEQGHAYAQSYLGFMYEKGRGVQKNYEEAVKWDRLAAKQGHATAQTNLGFMYEKGRGVQKNYEEAVKWYSLAAEQEYARAQTNLGFMYDKGRGVQKNYEEAVKWYRLAAEQEYARAQTHLGFMYDKGRGVRQDDEEAVKWYRLAAEQEYARAQANLGFMYDKGRGVRQDDEEAVKWYRLAAEQGYASGQFYLGWMYDKGRGVRQDDEEAVKWYRLAAEQGSVNAQYNLGLMYREGEGVRQDDEMAVKWFRLAAEQGHADAQRNLERLTRAR